MVGWNANVNDVNATATPFAESYKSGTVLKNDFRIDLNGRCNSSSWRDNRSGPFDVYTRVVPSIP